MKLFSLAAVLLAPILSVAQPASKLLAKPDPNKPLTVVETSCGECKFDLPGRSCDVAVRLPDGSYYVDGVGIKEYGHPHDANGFCVAVRKAEVQGQVVDGRFKATYFNLLPVDSGKPLGVEETGNNGKHKAKQEEK